MGPERLSALVAGLSQRDLAVLAAVGQHRFLSTIQIQRLHFHDHASPLSSSRSARRVIRRLAQEQLLSALPRRVGGFTAGSVASIWHLSPPGLRLLARTTPEHSTARQREPSPRLVDHYLSIAEAHIGLIEAARAERFALSRVELEPRSWRRYLGGYGQAEVLKPDISITTTSPDGAYEDHWFIEVDLGSEHPPTVVRKCQQYQAFRATGQQQQTSGVFPLAVWATTTDSRVDKLSSALRASRSLDQALFRVVRLDQISDLIATTANGGTS